MIVASRAKDQPDHTPDADKQHENGCQLWLGCEAEYNLMVPNEFLQPSPNPVANTVEKDYHPGPDFRPPAGGGDSKKYKQQEHPANRDQLRGINRQRIGRVRVDESKVQMPEKRGTAKRFVIPPHKAWKADPHRK